MSRVLLTNNKELLEIVGKETYLNIFFEYLKSIDYTNVYLLKQHKQAIINTTNRGDYFLVDTIAMRLCGVRPQDHYTCDEVFDMLDLITHNGAILSPEEREEMYITGD